jgi:ornithine decarboxylase
MATARLASFILPSRTAFLSVCSRVASLQKTKPTCLSAPIIKPQLSHVWSCQSAVVGRTHVMQRMVELKTHIASVSVNDLGQAERQYARWQTHLPHVACRYAIKCNPDSWLVRTLAEAGAGFDCASVAELDLVFRQSSDTDPSKVILAHPVKSVPDLLCAKRHGVRKMTFDSICELQKIAVYYPDAHLVLRLLPDDSYSKMPFGSKFGAPLEHVEALLQEARRLHLRVIGTSFHVGSACQNPIAYEKAIALSRHVFDIASSNNNNNNSMSFLDLGGGLLADETFECFAKQITMSLQRHFPRTDARFAKLEVVAEPGRYMAAPFSTLYTRVQGKKKLQAGGKDGDDEDEEHQAIFLGDGVYGSFNGIVFDQLQPVPHVEDSWCEELHINKPSVLSTLFGPTCDSGDVICKRIRMPHVTIGNWLRFDSMGAYTHAAASHFNGIPQAAQIYIHSREK